MIARISLANRKLVAILATLIVAFGIYATMSLQQQLLPALSFPSVTVVATYPGAPPEVVEQQVTAPIEKAIAGLDGLESTTSTSQQGSASVMVSFSYDTDTDEASAAVEKEISKISSQFPSGAETDVVTGSTADVSAMVLAVTSDGDLGKLATDLESKVVPTLRAVDGVNDVAVSGKREQIVTVTPNNDALATAGLSTQSVIDALSTLGGTSSAGQITANGRNLSLAVGQSVTSLQQIQDLWVSAAASGGSQGTSSGGEQPDDSASQSTGTASTAKPVQLKSVATVALADAPITSITRTDGKQSLGISLTMDHDASSPAISSAIRAELSTLETALGGGAKITIVSDSGPAVTHSVNGLVEEGALGLVMAILVIVLFLRSARATIVTAVSIPLSLLVALIAVWQQGYSLNVLTLGALTIAVGRVVDDSIVVLENIKRHLGYGRRPEFRRADGCP